MAIEILVAVIVVVWGRYNVYRNKSKPPPGSKETMSEVVGSGIGLQQAGTAQADPAGMAQSIEASTRFWNIFPFLTKCLV